ncbi:phage holin family protein [uncultured Pelagimonas sp.]|uniref:phage holin family protein n=1 Tax=uncultured Pelagimonas sp. TaxID=1618102 RepID=UPI0026147264|nr:phage holin family protein [uncultured Pelagimonas sp.]
MSRISRNISIVMRSERLIAQRHLAVLRQQTMLMAAAGIAAGVGLIMLNVSAYLALSDVVSQPVAALIVALVNIVLAGFLISMAGKSNAEQETAPVAEVRDMALEDLEAEVRSAAQEAKAATDAIRQMASNPLGAIAPGLAGTVASAVIKNLKK